jgi:hypothetical protein
LRGEKVTDSAHAKEGFCKFNAYMFDMCIEGKVLIKENTQKFIIVSVRVGITYSFDREN